MQNRNRESRMPAYGCWDGLLSLLKNERTTSLAEMLILTTVAEQAVSGSIVNLNAIRVEDVHAA